MDTGANGRPLGWPRDHRFYLTLDFECDFGTALDENHYHSIQRVDDLVEIIEAHDVPLTTFVQTEVLEKHPETVETLREASVPVEFHPHSHTHAPREATSVSEEITQSTAVYREFFGEQPIGYRFPNGNVRSSDYSTLADADYDFDASLFPSWRPGHFDHSDALTVPFQRPESDLYEIPFTVLSDRLRIPTSLSYCRLLGFPFVGALSRRPPSTVVLNVHMHDLFVPPSRERLSMPYRFVYSRNPAGFDLLDQILSQFASLDYAFGRFGELLANLDQLRE